MNLVLKKVIAREFLLLVMCFVATIATHGGLYFYHYLLSEKASGISQEANDLSRDIENLSAPFKRKTANQWWLYNKSCEVSGKTPQPYGHIQFFNHFVKTIQQDSLDYKWNNAFSTQAINTLHNAGFDSPESFRHFILENLCTPAEVADRQKARELEAIRESKNHEYEELRERVWYDEKILYVSSRLFVVLLIFFFGLRYLVYATQWSISVLTS
jgi:hypothetical protein